MKLINKILFFAFILQFSIVSNEDKNNSSILFISTPRSGNHWLSYCITTLSGHRVVYETRSRTDAVYSDQVASIKTDHIVNPRIFQEHHEKLIVLTRNHLDSLLRIHGTFPRCISFLKTLIGFKNRISYFQYPLYLNERILTHGPKEAKKWSFLYEQLAVYDLWESDKILIYYEELISEPRKTLEKLMLFLNESDWPIDDFIEEIESHKQLVRNFYNSKIIGKCQSNGNTIHPYSKNLTPDQIEQINSLLEELDPLLFNKYLKDCKYNRRI